MNIRIMKLAEEHGLVISEADDEYYTTYETDSSQLHRFAWDIIQECISACNSRVGNSDYNTGRMHCVSDIKERFGIKE